MTPALTITREPVHALVEHYPAHLTYEALNAAISDTLLEFRGLQVHSREIVDPDGLGVHTLLRLSLLSDLLGDAGQPWTGLAELRFVTTEPGDEGIRHFILVRVSGRSGWNERRAVSDMIAAVRFNQAVMDALR